MLMINPQHAVSHPLQAHSALETHPCFRLILRYTRLLVDLHLLRRYYARINMSKNTGGCGGTGPEKSEFQEVMFGYDSQAVLLSPPHLQCCRTGQVSYS